MSENPYFTPRHADDRPKKKWPGIWLTVLTVFGVGTLVSLLLLPMVRFSPNAARRSVCSQNLKQIAAALLNYESTYDALPPAYTVDAKGKPLHSWRTLILPYLESQELHELYETIDLSKPWDDPANEEACNCQVPVFRCPAISCPHRHTTYLANVASNGCFRLTEPRHFFEITDGLSQTLMIIEAPSDRSVPWMSPNDADEALVMDIGLESQLAHATGTQAVRCDGSVLFLFADSPAAVRRALISIAGNDNLEDY